jgi:hypothetical protein
VDIRIVGERLLATAQFATRDQYPFADTVFQLIRGGFLRATSVGFLPTKWKYRSDGVDFEEQELLEFSVVPVPANPEALLVNAKAAGIDTKPVLEWARRISAAGQRLDDDEIELDEEDLKQVLRQEIPRSIRDAFDRARGRLPDEEIDIEIGDDEEIDVTPEQLRQMVGESVRDALRQAAGRLPD